MIHHLVLFKLKRGVGRDDHRLDGVISAMDALPLQVGTVRAWEHGFNVTEEPAEGDYSPAQAWDYALRAVFDDRSALHGYFEHPAHLPVVEAWEEIADLAYCDIVV